MMVERERWINQKYIFTKSKEKKIKLKKETKKQKYERHWKNKRERFIH